MFLASEELPDWRAVVFGTIGIWLLAGAGSGLDFKVRPPSLEIISRSKYGFLIDNGGGSLL